MPAPAVSPDIQALFWSRENARCEQSLEHLASRYLRIKGKSEIGLRPLTPNRVQRFIQQRMDDQRQRLGKIRLVAGKARQVTFTTWTRALAFQQTAFASDRNAIMVAHDEPTARTVFADQDVFFYQHLPDPLRPRLEVDTTTEMSFKARRSRSIARWATNANVGAASAYHVMHLTEAARYISAGVIQSSVFPTLSDAPGSVGIIESTSVYGGDWYKDFAEAARTGDNGAWEFVFIPWYWHDEYVAPVPRHFTLNAEEKALARQHSLTMEQLAWRRGKLAEYGKQRGLFLSEYPASWDESWVTPEGAFRVFAQEKLEPLRAALSPGTAMIATPEGLKPYTQGLVRVWEPPQPDVFYHLGLDLAGGDPNTKQGDWTVACVVRRDTLEQVAEWRLRIPPSSPEFLDQLEWLGTAYHRADIYPDVTGGWGPGVVAELQRRGYHNLTHRQRRLDAKERDTEQLGFYATEREKAVLVQTAAMAVEQDEITIHSETLWNEMAKYMSIGLGAWAGKPHDDAIFAFMLAILAAKDVGGGRLGVRLVAPVKTEAEELAEMAAAEPHKYHDWVNDLAGTHPTLVHLAPWR